MVIRAGKPVTAGLSQVAQMDHGERVRVVRQLSGQYPAFRALLTQVAVARGVAFASGLTLAVAIILLVQNVSVWCVATLVFAGLGGFVYVAIALTDSRFDLLLAVLGAHRTDELHGMLVTEQVYGDEPDQPERPDHQQAPVLSSRPVRSRGFRRAARHRAETERRAC